MTFFQIKYKMSTSYLHCYENSGCLQTQDVILQKKRKAFRGVATKKISSITKKKLTNLLPFQVITSGIK